MKLVNRVSVFFLAALAVVLIVYSGFFYAIVRARLVQQFEQELNAALNSLVAAVEVEPEEVKWQPLEHTIALGAVRGPEEVQWAVVGDGDRVVESSRNVRSELTALARSMASEAARGASSRDVPLDDGWRVIHQRLVAPSPERIERELDEFDEIVVVVARSVVPLHADIRRLLWLTGALPVGTWLVAAAAGHWFCRRALQPVLDMSQQARSATQANFDFRFPIAETQDELADLGTAFNTLLNHQHRAFEQQRRFTSAAAHELRTPLTVLLGQIDVALRRTRSPQEYAVTLAVLRDETAQLQAIVESLLFLARAGEDAILTDAATFSLSAWLPEYLSRWNKHPRRGDISLRASATESDRIKASPPLLERLLDNLLENALKYSSPGSSIEISTGSENGEVVVNVQDHGRGIATEDLADIFQPFFRSREARAAGIAGTGLGLAIAARVATASGGRLDCTSEPGCGSRFSLRLPKADD